MRQNKIIHGASMNSEGQPTLPSLGCSLQISTCIQYNITHTHTHSYIHTLKVREKFEKILKL